MDAILEIAKIVILIVGGGVGVKLFELFFLSKSKKADIEKTLRMELREELTYLRAELKLINTEYDKLKKEVLELISDNKTKNVEITELQYKINRLLDSMKESQISEREKNMVTHLIAYYSFRDKYKDAHEYLQEVNDIVEKIVKNRETRREDKK